MRTIQIRRACEAPDLNGDLSQPAWKNAQWNSGFTVSGQPEVKAKDQTAFAMIYDAENLYVAAQCEMDPDQPQETGWEKEDPKGEIQLVVDSEGTGLRSSLFMIYGNGSTEVKFVDPDSNVNDWPGTVRCASKTEGAAWVVQFSVGLAGFKYGVCGHQQWKFNVVRLPSRFGPARWSTFAPLKGTAEATGFFLPQYVVGASAVFEHSELMEPFLWTVGAAGRARMVETTRGRICRQDLRVTNLLSKSRSVELRYRIDPGAETDVPLRFGPNEARLETIEAPVEPDFEFGQLHVKLMEHGTSRCLSKSDVFVEAEPLSWKEHFVKRWDGKGSYTPCPAQMQFLPRFEGRKMLAFGLAQMDNGEIIMGGFANDKTVFAFSKDGGATWSEYYGLNRGSGKAGPNFAPMYLTYLGKGSLSILQGLNLRLFSHDYGRTWSEEAPYPPAPDGWPMMVEGNNMVDRDSKGNAVRIAETGQTYPEGGVWPGGVPGQPQTTHCSLWFHWSNDGGRTWKDVSRPEAWRWRETYKGKTWNFSAYEGGLVRAANGWIVAALRMSLAAKYVGHPYLGDHFMGTGVSISKDDGKTWSPIRRIFDEGRHHSNLIRLPNGDLMMTVIRRIDIRNGKLASYRRGCDAVVSRDHGLTWDVEHMYNLDDFPFCEGDRWEISGCGHLYSIVLDDGFVLTTFSNHTAGGELIKWKP